MCIELLKYASFNSNICIGVKTFKYVHCKEDLESYTAPYFYLFQELILDVIFSLLSSVPQLQVLGNISIVMTVGMSILIFQNEVSTLSIVGSVCILLGSVMYQNTDVPRKIYRRLVRVYGNDWRKPVAPVDKNEQTLGLCKTKALLHSRQEMCGRFNLNCTGLFCTMIILGGGGPRRPTLQTSAPKGPIVAKFGTRLRNCAKRKTCVIFLKNCIFY